MDAVIQFHLGVSARWRFTRPPPRALGSSIAATLALIPWPRGPVAIGVLIVAVTTPALATVSTPLALRTAVAAHAFVLVGLLCAILLIVALTLVFATAFLGSGDRLYIAPPSTRI